MTTFLVYTAEGNVIGEGSDLPKMVANLIDLGYTSGTIDNQDGGKGSLTEWIEDNGERIEQARVDMLTGGVDDE